MHEVDRILKLLREKIREQGYTQVKVQKALGWGRTYISQLLRKQKSLRFEQVLQILHVIEIEPEEFFAEFYGKSGHDSGPPEPVSELWDESESSLESHHRAMMNGLIRLLIDKEVIKGDELSSAVRACDDGRA